MKIELKYLNIVLVTITDEHDNNDNYVRVTMHDDANVVNLDELIAALEAFRAKRTARLEKEQLEFKLKI